MILYALVIYIFWYKKVLQVGYTLKKYFKEIVKTYGSIVLYWVLLLTKSGTITLMNLHTQLLLKFDCPQKKITICYFDHDHRIISTQLSPVLKMQYLLRLNI